MAIAGFDSESNPEGKANGFNYRSADSEFSGSGGIAAGCPADQRITGGGAALDGDPSNAELTLIGSDSISPEVSAKNGFGGRAEIIGSGQTLTIFAICTKTGGINLRSKAQKDSPLPGDLVTAKAKCPRGTSVLGGGVRAETTPELMLASAPFDSKDPGLKPDDGWTVRLENGQGINDIFAIAICSKKLKPHYATNSTPTGSGELVRTAACDQDEAVVGGGGAVTGDADAYLNATHPADISDADTTPSDGWRSVAYVDAGAQALTSYAICVS